MDGQWWHGRRQGKNGNHTFGFLRPSLFYPFGQYGLLTFRTSACPAWTMERGSRWLGLVTLGWAVYGMSVSPLSAISRHWFSNSYRRCIAAFRRSGTSTFENRGTISDTLACLCPGPLQTRLAATTKLHEACETILFNNRVANFGFEKVAPMHQSECRSSRLVVWSYQTVQSSPNTPCWWGPPLILLTMGMMFGANLDFGHTRISSHVSRKLHQDLIDIHMPYYHCQQWDGLPGVHACFES